jgi:hypothetical protein
MSLITLFPNGPIPRPVTPIVPASRSSALEKQTPRRRIRMAFLDRRVPFAPIPSPQIGPACAVSGEIERLEAPIVYGQELELLEQSRSLEDFGARFLSSLAPGRPLR